MNSANSKESVLFNYEVSFAVWPVQYWQHCQGGSLNSVNLGYNIFKIQLTKKKIKKCQGLLGGADLNKINIE